MNTFKMQVPNGFMLARGFKPVNPMSKKREEPVKSYGDKSDRIIAFVQDKAATIADIALYFGWTKTATSSLVNKIERVHKVIKLDLQVMNNRSVTVVRGLDLVADYEEVKDA